MTRISGAAFGRAGIRLLPVAMFAFAQAGLAQSGSQAMGQAEAEVIVPIRAAPIADRSFGLIVLGPAGSGTVEVAADRSPPRYTKAARTTFSGEAGCMAHRAQFDVAGEPNRSYRVTLPEQISARGIATGASLPVIRIAVRSMNAASAMSEGQLDQSGQDSFFIGGTLQVPAGTRQDVFRADLPVIVTYN